MERAEEKERDQKRRRLKALKDEGLIAGLNGVSPDAPLLHGANPSPEPTPTATSPPLFTFQELNERLGRLEARWRRELAEMESRAVAAEQALQQAETERDEIKSLKEGNMSEEKKSEETPRAEVKKPAEEFATKAELAASDEAIMKKLEELDKALPGRVNTAIGIAVADGLKPGGNILTAINTDVVKVVGPIVDAAKTALTNQLNAVSIKQSDVAWLAGGAAVLGVGAFIAFLIVLF